MLRLLRCCFVAGSVAWPICSVAEVTQQELLSTCGRALAQHYSGLEAAMCDWYVKPCGVCGVDAPHNAWCIPNSVPAEDIAKIVTQEISTHPENASKSVKAVVQEILTAHFPCAKNQQ